MSLAELVEFEIVGFVEFVNAGRAECCGCIGFAECCVCLEWGRKLRMCGLVWVREFVNWRMMNCGCRGCGIGSNTDFGICYLRSWTWGFMNS